ncbi:HNH endonuclease [Roseivirga pacifica]|uniref:HNH endonuclease n=1 Tax=Roseivirga pacifica TaxID=1267423 RepID=UPI00209632FE|nr:HNH endonuclease [Roseivirga pacifica]MCO6357615.1 HNH endonuclease [Roseivirga pacifica]MCO6365868.1 HNH endonuclease [Roseivirga pacifica]MCO6371196.1 HNH endonuclease [Roseivirga pacifica]MCO6375633.1 HNH endonuclease [Roseivirga pacifica]MCO6378574.1 HNH endonuclease [Roseivirga pacifica]
MMKRVLVLNQDYSPISVCSAERAFLLLYLQKAELVHDNPENKIRSINTAYPMPSVIRLQQYISIPYKSVLLSRQNVFKRDSNQCLYCGNGKDLTLDHVLPKSRGGQSTWTNLATACKKCNSIKGDKTPEEAKMPLAQKPFRPTYVMFVRNFSGFTSKDWLKYLGVN